MNRFAFWFMSIHLFGCAGSLLRSPGQGSNLGLLPWEHGGLATGPTGKSLFCFFKEDDMLVTQKHKWSTKRI